MKSCFGMRDSDYSPFLGQNIIRVQVPNQWPTSKHTHIHGTYAARQTLFFFFRGIWTTSHCHPRTRASLGGGALLLQQAEAAEGVSLSCLPRFHTGYKGCNASVVNQPRWCSRRLCRSWRKSGARLQDAGGLGGMVSEAHLRSIDLLLPLHYNLTSWTFNQHRVHLVKTFSRAGDGLQGNK